MSDLVLPSENQEKPKHGGRRNPPGGRPPNEVKYKAKISKATDIMGRMLPEAAQATVDLATGAYYLMIWNPKTKTYEKPRTAAVADRCVAIGGDMIRVYRELPSAKAIEIMFDRLMGKVPQPIDITTRQAVGDIMEAQRILMRVIEEHVPEEYLATIRAELERVAQHHSDARAAVGL